MANDNILPAQGYATVQAQAIQAQNPMAGQPEVETPIVAAALHNPYVYANALLIVLVIFFPLRERRVEYVGGIWWVRIAFLLLIALVAEKSRSAVMTAALLGVVYVLTMSARASRHLPLTAEAEAEAASMPAEPMSAMDPARPEVQVASVRHRQYADLIERCLHPSRKDSPTCAQLQKLHRVVDTLHSRVPVD